MTEFISGLVYCVCIYVVYVCVYVQGYNIETTKAGIHSGEAGSQFGYSVAIVRKPGWESNHNADFHDKTLLIGAPNRTVVRENIFQDGRTEAPSAVKGHGDVSRCDNPTAENITCSWMYIRDNDKWLTGSNATGLCKKLRTSSSKIHCEQDSRLGASISVNRKYDTLRKSISTLPMVTVCAPSWKQVFSKQPFLIGMCLKLREQLTVLPCVTDDQSKRYSYCWPFWPSSGKSFTRNGRPYYMLAQGGIASSFSSDGRSELIGATGVNDWRGGVRSIKASWDFEAPNEHMSPTTYLGYALISGRFKVTGANLAVGIPNFYSSYGHFGKVELLNNDIKVEETEYGIVRKCRGVVQMSDIEDKTQVGTKFGAAVAAIDVTGDGFDELFVGAPMFSGENPDEGRVFVYTFTNETFCGPIGILSGGAKHSTYKSQAYVARFGTTITSAGDLDCDGFKDIAIGAPYEDNGAGVVYIYQGIGTCGCLMEDKFVQRITGRSIKADIRGFGWSIYGNEDIDRNIYPGNRPIVEVKIAMDIVPNPIPVNADLANCRTDDQLCLNVTVRFEMTFPRKVSEPVVIEWTLNADTIYFEKEKESRIVFRNTVDNTKAEQIELTGDVVMDKTYEMDVVKYNNDPEPKDALIKVRIVGSYKLVPKHEKEFDKLDPILKLGSETHIVAEADFDKIKMKCQEVSTCKSDLNLKVDMFLADDGRDTLDVEIDTTIYIGNLNKLQVLIDVWNKEGISYRADFTSMVDTQIRSVARYDLGIKNATCKIKLFESPLSTQLNCSEAGNKLSKNENFRVGAVYDISPALLVPSMDTMKTYIKVKVTAGQDNIDINDNNNKFEHTIHVALKYLVEIFEDTGTSDQVRYKADDQSTSKIRLIHRFYITNRGPSFFPRTYVNISVPVAKSDQIVAVIKNKPSTCIIRGSSEQTQTTNQPHTVSTSKWPTITSPDTQHRWNDVFKPEKQTGAETIAASKNSKRITCVDDVYTCEILECKIGKLEKGVTENITIIIDIIEKAIASETGVREVRYNTNATVTDPIKWYGGKVVAWDKTVYAEKWTTMLVHPYSVVYKINIWIIIGSVLGAVLILVVLIVILWNCGFFQRKHHQENIRQKQQILNHRKRQYRAFMNSQKSDGGQEYSQLAAASEKYSPIATTSDEYYPIATTSDEYSPMATASDEYSFQPPPTNMSQ